MSSILTDLLEYNHIFNQKLSAQFLRDGDKSTEASRKWFNHILNAHHIWINRILGKTPEFNPWSVHDPAYFSDLDKENYALSLLVLEEHRLDEIITYTNSLGKTYSNRVQDILLHIVNHSTYHRGQIAHNMRENGLEPIPSDYIMLRRQE